MLRIYNQKCVLIHSISERLHAANAQYIQSAIYSGFSLVRRKGSVDILIYGSGISVSKKPKLIARKSSGLATHLEKCTGPVLMGKNNILQSPI